MSRLAVSVNNMHHRRSSLSATASDQPPLPDWFLSLPGVPALSERIGATELRRRLFHMSPALIPIGMPFIPHRDAWDPLVVTSAFSFAIVGLIAAQVLAPYFTRPNEQSWMPAVWGYILPMLAALILFPDRVELALMTLQIVALGDGSALLGGKLLGGARLPWNPEKTFSGFCCFVLIGSVAATLSYWSEAHPAVSIGRAFFVCGTAALCAGTAESLPLRSSDNFRVGATALATGAAISFWIA